MKIKITADSTCDLSKELVEKYDIEIIPLYVVTGDQSYKDACEIDADKLYAMVKDGLKFSTSAVNVNDYLEVFEKIRRDYDAVIHFTISSEMSSCYQNACLAGEEIDHVYVIDSRNLSTGIGHLVIDAAEMAASGMDALKIQEVLNEKKQRLDVSFVIDTMEYLRRGGRCSGIAALGATMLKLHPSILVKNGEMLVGKKYRGSVEKCYHNYVKDALHDPEEIDAKRIFITHSGEVNESTIAEIKQTITSVLHFDEILVTRAGCTVSNHCGPKTMGILFYRKK